MEKKTDIIPMLQEIVAENTTHYQDDLLMDVGQLSAAMLDPVPENRVFLWMCRPCGTWCFLEREVFLRDTVAHNTWTYQEYIIQAEKIKAYPGITVEAKGYQTSTRTVTATRSYPNLSDADASLIPRTIQDGGRTLTLADVQWQEAGGFYNARATYSSTASSKYATGYIATVEYKGEVSRTSCDTVLYPNPLPAVKINSSLWNGNCVSW